MSGKRDEQHCETCRHWLRAIDPSKPGLCLLLSGEEDKLKAFARVWPKPKRNQKPEFCTYPDFGCVYWNWEPTHD